jgi:hypothetical protein
MTQFHKGDLVETSWGERAITLNTPKSNHFNITLRYHHRRMPGPMTGFHSIARLKLIRRAPKAKVPHVV